MLLCVCAPVWAAQGVVTVTSKPFTPHMQAYAMVRPIALVRVRSTDTGKITHIGVLPGQSVKRNQTLARLSGSELQAQLTALRAQVRSGRARL